VKGRGDERAVASKARELLEIVRIPDAAAGDERHTRSGVSHVCNHPSIESSAASNAREIDHDQRACARGACAGGNGMGALVASNLAARPRHRFAVAQIQAERHPIAAESGTDLVQLGIRLQRLEANDDAGDVQRTHVARTRDRRHAGIEPERNANRRHPSHERVLWRFAADRVEIGGIQRIDAEIVDIRARDPHWIAGLDRDTCNRPHRLIPIALPATRMDGAPLDEIKNANDQH
jgi:hypothetical protein